MRPRNCSDDRLPRRPRLLPKTRARGLNYSGMYSFFSMEDLFLSKKWLHEWPLSKFYDMIFPLSENQFKENKKILQNKYIDALDNLFLFRLNIGYTLKRLSENSLHWINKDFQVISEEKRDGIKAFSVINLIMLDVTNFIIYSQLYMNRIARVIHIFTHNGFGIDNFQKWIDNRDRLDQERFENIVDIIDTANWYPRYKKIRDKYIIHNANKIGDYLTSILGVEIRYRSYVCQKEMHVNLKEIRKISDDMIEINKLLNDFLYSNISELPLRIY